MEVFIVMQNIIACRSRGGGIAYARREKLTVAAKSCGEVNEYQERRNGEAMANEMR
jgi:hypothetical protein